MARSSTRRLAALSALSAASLLVLALGGCSAIGQVVIDQLEDVSQGDGSGNDASDDDVSYVTHDNGNTDFYDLAVGMCIDEDELFGEDYFASVDVVDCAQPHYAEVSAFFDLADGAYPGDDEAWRLAEAGCVERFTEYVGASWEETDYDFSYFYPDDDNWRTGDHEVMCLVVDYDFEPITGSARNGVI